MVVFIFLLKKVRYLFSIEIIDPLRLHAGVNPPIGGNESVATDLRKAANKEAFVRYRDLHFRYKGNQINRR